MKYFKNLLLILLISCITFSADDIVQDEGLVDTDGRSDVQRQEMEDNKETHGFRADVSRVLDILIQSLYSQKEIFLREAISNASDALDKVRFLSVQDPTILESKKDLGIWIEADPEAKTISITDSGIGMTRSDLINNLGTIAKTDTIKFLENMTKEGNLNLIGQFGVGFYSLFLVGERVTVTSKNNEDDQYVWESTASSEFTVAKDPLGNTLGRGTRITIHLKNDCLQFHNVDEVRKVVKQYSEFINFPISLRVKKEISKEVEIEEEENFTDETEANKTKDDMEISEDSESDGEAKKKTKTVKETVLEWEVANDAQAIWTRSRNEIEQEQYQKFYKDISKDYDNPLTHIHFRAEGEVEFTSILFIPKKASRDTQLSDSNKNLKLYVRRVLISDTFEDLLPRYLNFVKGVVDSDDIPLNVSRENLQQLKMIKVMQRKLVRKVLEMVQKLATAASSADDEQPDEDMTDLEREEFEKKKAERKKELSEKYEKFWTEYGKNIKLGIAENPGNREKLARLCRFYTSQDVDSLTSFDDYIDRSTKSQDSIYFIAGDDRQQLMKSPVIQGLLKKGYEVLLLDDNIDEYAMSHLTEYSGKKLVNVAKGSFKFPQDDEEKKKLSKLKKMYMPLSTYLKDKFSDKIERVEVSLKLTSDPVAVIASEHGYSASMERLARGQAHANGKQAMWQNMKKVFEINPYHPFVKELLERVKAGADEDTEQIASLLYDVGLMSSGYILDETTSFAGRFYRILSDAMGLDRDLSTEEFDLPDEEEPEAKVVVDAETETEEPQYDDSTEDL